MSALLDDVAARTDVYFKRTRAIVERAGDVRVTYAVFLRRPVISAPRLMLEWLDRVAAAQHTAFDIELRHPEGVWTGAGEPIAYVTGSFAALSELETILLQKLGPACVAAHNAYQMCLALPTVGFLAMDARHCAGAEMQDAMAYAASVGGAAARREGAVGFVGNATDGTAHWFGNTAGRGTMPHSLIGYAGSTVRAAEMFHATFPDEPLTVLVDYFGREITDALAVCARYPDLAGAGRLSVRLDTHGGRFLEGLDPAASYAVLERHAPGAIRRYRSDTELRFLVGTGVSAAAIWRMREALDAAGFAAVRIVASSGFGVDKCRTMADAKAPVDVVGTGSFIPEAWGETYATADVVEYRRAAAGEGRAGIPASPKRGWSTQSMRIISFRDRVDLPDLLSWNYELWNGDLDGQICFDFKNVKFLTPSAMLFIAHQIRFLQAIRPSTRLQMSQYKHLGYAGHMGFFACFGASFGKAVGEALGDINYLPITELVTKDFLNSKGNTGINESIDLESSRLARVLTRLGSGYTYDIVHYALREIMRNVFEHSGSKNLMYCGQYWPSRQRVEIVLADEGMGVADSLRYNPKFKGLSERDALHFSCMPGVSGNFRALRGEGPMSVWTNSGYGLYMTSRLCRNVGGF